MSEKFQFEGKFIESFVRKHYQILNHAPLGATEVVAIWPEYLDKGGIAAIGFFDNENDLVKAVEPWHGKANLFIGVNPRDRSLLNLAPNKMVEGLDSACSEIAESC